MLRPSYSELMEILNQQEGIDMKVNSRYTIVIAAAKRARQIIDGSEPMATATSDKAVSLAISEIHKGMIGVWNASPSLNTSPIRGATISMDTFRD